MNMRRTTSLIASVAGCIVLMLLVSPRSRAHPGQLRVCSDPNNLPFSNRAEAGFEDALAKLVGGELGLSVTHYFWAQRRGFVRNTLKADKCDLIMGVPAGSDMLLTTRPYYRSSYVFVTRSEAPSLRSFDDPRLRSMRVGVPLIGDDYANPPPVHALSRRGIVENVRGFSVFGDYGKDSPPLELLRALSRGEIDVAIAWGPLAGFAVKRSEGKLKLSPVSPRAEGPNRFTFAVAMGVRLDARDLKHALDRILQHKRQAVQELLGDYGVPQI
jgi:mxaJ protein